MVEFKYGEFTDDQVKVTKRYMQKQIYFLLLYVDKSTRDEYPDVDVRSAFDSILHWFGGLNEVLFYPAELVRVISMLEAAKIEYEKSDFDFSEYRKLILGAGSEVMKIKEVD